MNYTPQNLKRATGSRLREYFVAPVTHHRDSDLLTESNWDAQLATLKPLHADVPSDPDEDGSPVVIRDRNPLVGWAEWLAIHQDNSEALEAADKLAERLESYPILDEEDNSRREWEDYERSWADYGQRDFFAMVAKEFKLQDVTRDWLRGDCGPDIAREFFESCVPSGEYYIPDGSGVSINCRSAIQHLIWKDNRRELLAQFIRKARKASRTVTA